MAADKAVRLRAILTWLEHDRITTADACNRIRALHLTGAPAPSPGATVAAHANGDLPVPDGTTFAEVADAYTAGRITRSQYDQLAQAVTRS